MREPGPIGAELELHGNSGYDPEKKVDCKYLSPETRGLVVSLIPFPECERLEDDDERGQPHRQLRKEVVIGNRKRKVQTMNYECAVHYECPLSRPAQLNQLLRGTLSAQDSKASIAPTTAVTEITRMESISHAFSLKSCCSVHIRLNFRQDLTSSLHFRQCKLPNDRNGVALWARKLLGFRKTDGKELLRLAAKK